MKSKWFAILTILIATSTGPFGGLANAAELGGVDIHGFISQGFLYSDEYNYLRVREKINSQIDSVQAPAQQGAKTKEYPAYAVFSERH